MRKHKSVILKLLSAACALLLAIQVMSPAAYALNGVGEGSDATSGPLYDVYQIFQCDVRPAEEADLPYLDEGVQIGDKLASNFRFGKNFGLSIFADISDAELAATGVVLEIGGTIPDTIVEELVMALYGSSYDDQDYTIGLQKILDADSEPYASGLTLSELNAYAAEPGYYLITNTPGSVTGNNGYTRGITTVTDSETGFDVIPKSFSLEIDKSVARIPSGGTSFLTMLGDGPEPFTTPGPNFSDYLPGILTTANDVRENAPGLADNLMAVAPGLALTNVLFNEDYNFSFNKKVLLNASDAALYRLTVRVPEAVYDSFPDYFYMQIQDMLPDGFVGFPVIVTVTEDGEILEACDASQLIQRAELGSKGADGGARFWLSNIANSADFDLLRSEFRINALLNLTAYFVLPARAAERAVDVNVYIYAMPVLDGHDADQMPITLDANVNNSRLLYQNNPNEQVDFFDSMYDFDYVEWHDRVGGTHYQHACSDAGIGSAGLEVTPKQLSLACTADSDRTQADAYLSGLTFYYGSQTGQPIADAKFSLQRLPLVSNGTGASGEYEALSGMTFAALRQPVFSASEIGLYRKLTSGAYTPLTNLPADRYADELLYQAHAAHMPSLGYIGPMLPQDGGTDLDEARFQELLDKNAVMITTDENGMVSFVGLPMGDYCLEPLAPVQGYNIAEPVYFRIEADASGEGRQISFVRPDATGCLHSDFGPGVSLFDFNAPENAPELVMSPDGWFYLNLIATSGVVLPTTGGAGTVAIIAAGAGLLGIAAALVLIRRKRQVVP